MTRFACSFRGMAPLMAATILLATPAFAVQRVDNGDLDSLSGTYLAARTADVEKDVASAARFYRAALKADPDNLFLLERALVLSAGAGNVDDAIGFARRLREKQPSNSPARLVLAVEQVRLGQYSAAVEELGDTGAGVLADLTNALVSAWARFGEGEVDSAISGLQALKGEDWYESFKLLHSGYIALAAGRTDEAVKYLGDARERDPNAVRITEAYARALAIAGRTKEATDALNAFLVNYPDNALAVAALDDIQSGRAHVAALANPVEGAAEALAGIGAAVGQEGGTEVAFLYLRLALYLDPNIAGGLAALSLGNLFDTNDQSEAAIAAYESISPEAPFHALGQLRAALALDRLDRTDEAEKAFKQAIAGNPDDVQSYISYGNMLRGRERFAEAAKVYEEAIGKIASPGPADWSLFYFRGIAYERTKQWPKAEADFKKALELSPDQPLVLNYLGYSWVDMGRNLEEAMAMIQKAVELRPNDGYIVDSLGWAHYRLGQYDKAVEELERAIGLKPDDPVINDHLGDAYWKTGRKLEAQFQWRHARDFGAEGEALELILRKIAEEQLIEPAVQKTDASSLYIVKPGDSLWTISAALLKSGEAFQKILDANKDKLKSPDDIYPGMQLLIPGNT
jgi:tetratricopeptide (TPR) repeat protein